jgi:putative alpha-1,2-mannosidase
MDKLYSPTPDGYCGDEDNGQTSAWYVFSALGFYPVCPGTDQYIIGTPLFDEVTLHFENGNNLRLTAERKSAKDCYIQQIEDDGVNSTRTYFTHRQLHEGGHLVYKLSATPNKEWGTKEEDLPYSMSR